MHMLNASLEGAGGATKNFVEINAEICVEQREAIKTVQRIGPNRRLA